MLDLNLLPVKYLEALAKSVTQSTDKKFIEKCLSEMISQYKVINSDPSYNQPYYRARKAINTQTFNNVNELYYPPKEITSVGRVNNTREPFLYLSHDSCTALAEINAQPGDFVQLSTYQPVGRSLRIMIIGEYLNIARSGRSFFPKALEPIKRIIHTVNKQGLNAINSFLYPDLFFDELMRNPDASKSDYIHSRVLTHLLFSNNQSVDAIWYHSVASNASINLALPACKADELLCFTGTRFIKVRNKFNYGIYDFEILKSPKGYSEDGKILW